MTSEGGSQNRRERFWTRGARPQGGGQDGRRQFHPSPPDTNRPLFEGPVRIWSQSGNSHSFSLNGAQVDGLKINLHRSEMHFFSLQAYCGD